MELLERALALRGTPVDVLGLPVRTKGKVGEAIERALGAAGGRGATLDFPDLGIELKTVPVEPSGKPRESTFVCAVQLADADRAEWATSWVRRKLARVLWVPIVHEGGQKTIGQAQLWSPTEEQESVMRSDFDEIFGAIGIGGIEGVTARLGRWLQLRPKAADSSARALSIGPDDSLVTTVPRGFYLRARFTGAILKDPGALP
jgi:DNA mismatch repair protein MutH